MERNGTGSGGGAGTGGPPRRRPRYIFQVDSTRSGGVIRILDTATDGVFREIPVQDFLAHARKSKDMRSLFFGAAGAKLGAALANGERD